MLIICIMIREHLKNVLTAKVELRTIEGQTRNNNIGYLYNSEISYLLELPHIQSF